MSQSRAVVAHTLQGEVSPGSRFVRFASSHQFCFDCQGVTAKEYGHYCSRCGQDNGSSAVVRSLRRQAVTQWQQYVTVLVGVFAGARHLVRRPYLPASVAAVAQGIAVISLMLLDRSDY